LQPYVKNSWQSQAKKAVVNVNLAPNDDKRYIKRNEKRRIKESDDQARSLSQDRRKPAKKKVKPGYGDKGDQKKSAAKK
jgi:hypothetical protein